MCIPECLGAYWYIIWEIFVVLSTFPKEFLACKFPCILTWVIWEEAIIWLLKVMEYTTTRLIKANLSKGHVIKCCKLCSLFYSHCIFQIYLGSQTNRCAMIRHGLRSPPSFLETFHSLKVRRERILVITLWLFISISLWINWTIIPFDWDYLIIPLRV